MLGSLGITDWITAAVTAWLAVQLPLGIVVGLCLRNISAVSLAQAVAEERLAWPELLAAPRTAPVLN